MVCIHAVYMPNTLMHVSVTIPVTIVTMIRTSQLVVILLSTSNKVGLEGSAVHIGARDFLCHPM